MAFRSNEVLITTATTVDVTANNTIDFFDGAGGATAFIVADGNVGDDEFVNFGSDDSLITGKRIFDGNGDGFIAFGDNGVLDVDRTRGGDSASARGPDQLNLSNGGNELTEIRYLGTKGGNFVYADANTLRDLVATFGDTDVGSDTNAGTNVVEGTVDSETIDAGGGATVILHDNGLGLNLGGDTITGFGDDDLLVTTAELFDSEGDGDIEFFNNFVLDISGATGAANSDPSTGPGGQLDFNAPDLQVLQFLGSSTGSNGQTYYYYGTAGSTFEPDMSA